MNPVVSDEQSIAIQHIINGDNVILDAVAGSGKSTTVLSTASSMSEKNFLLIAFNAMLRKETEAKVKSMGLTNVIVHTFHSLCVKYYLSSAHTDSGIRRVILNRMKPKEALPKIDVIVLDESQDMSFLYFKWMVKFARDMARPFQVFVLGDYMQGLYEFKGADIRSLTMADQMWRGHPGLISPVFHKCTLKTSYRITKPMAQFVNNVMLGQERLVACKEGTEVVYVRNSRRNLEIIVISQINALLDAGESPGDIFVLGASVKGVNSNIRKMENALVDKGIPCYVPMFDTEHIDDKIVNGKVVFSTFHSVKGRERKYVFVMGFDHSYFRIYAQNCEEDHCPNTLYVGCTRATHKLVLLECDQYATDQPLRFLKMTHRDMATAEYMQFRGVPREIFYDRSAKENSTGSIATEKFRDIAPTDLVKFIPDHVMEEISELMETIFIQIHEIADEIHIPTMIRTANGHYEDVCDLNGIAIPSIYYDHLCSRFQSSCNMGAVVLKQIIEDTLKLSKEGECVYLKQLQLPDPCTTPGDYLFLANVFVAAKEKLFFKLKQIKPEDYVWLTDEMTQACFDRLDQHLTEECATNIPLIEYPISNYDDEVAIGKFNSVLSPYFPPGEKRFRFSARADLMTERTIWELKCTSTISIEHKLQVVLYSWIWRTLHCSNPTARRPVFFDSRDVKLLNIRTGECFLLNANYEQLTIIVVALLKGKYSRPEIKSDEEFLEDSRETIIEFQ